MLINKIKEKFNINQPIFTEEIMELFPQYSRPYIFRLINNLEKSGELIRYSKGVYFIPKKTFFGVSTITADSVIEKKYLKCESRIAFCLIRYIFQKCDCQVF